MNQIHPAFLVALAAGTLAVHAQDKDPLGDLERAFASKVDAAQKPVTERYITALEALQKKYQSRGELPSAAAVSSEIEAAKARLDASQPLFPGRKAPPKIDGLFEIDSGNASARDEESDSIPKTARGDISLSPTAAKFSGGTSLLKPQEIVQGFVRTGSSASWTVTDLPAGIYDIIIDYSSGTKGGGGNIHVTALTSETDVEITPLGSWKTFRRKRIGGIRITTPPVSLTISTNSSKSPAGVMALRQVILRPRPAS